MSLLWVDGFDWIGTTVGNDAANLAYKYPTVSGSASTFKVGTGRYSGQALRFTNGATHYIQTGALGNIATVIVGFAFKSAVGYQAVNLLELYDSTTLQVALATTATGEWVIKRGGTTLATTSGASVGTDTWAHIELRVTIGESGAGGAYELRINGVNVLSDATEDTRANTNSYLNLVRFSINTGLAIDYYIDDMFILDTAGSVNNDFIGNRKVVTIRPAAEGATNDFTPSTGTNNALMVDDIASDDDSTYSESSTVGHKDMYDYDTLSGVGSINGIVVNTVAKLSDANPFNLITVVDPGVTESDGSSVGVASSYSTIRRVLETDPDTAAAWTVGGVNGSEFGAKVG